MREVELQPGQELTGTYVEETWHTVEAAKGGTPEDFGGVTLMTGDGQVGVWGDTHLLTAVKQMLPRRGDQLTIIRSHQGAYRVVRHDPH